MGEHEKIIVVESYPVDELPEKLRTGLEAGTAVRIVCEKAHRPQSKPSLMSIYERYGRVGRPHFGFSG